MLAYKKGAKTGSILMALSSSQMLHDLIVHHIHIYMNESGQNVPVLQLNIDCLLSWQEEKVVH